MMEPDGTYPMPEHGWTCFHCGETFRTPGSARDHFGATPEDRPACLIHTEDGRGLVMELRKVEKRLRDEEERRLRAEASLEQAEYELGNWRSVGGSVHELRNRIETWEGRVLVADTLTEAFRTKAPGIYAEVIG